MGTGIIPTRNRSMGSCQFGRKFEPIRSLVEIPKKLTFYNYIGNNPAKGGLFKAGVIDNGDKIVVGWLGHPIFKDKEGIQLFVHQMPTFSETFPVFLVHF